MTVIVGVFVTVFMPGDSYRWGSLLLCSCQVTVIVGVFVTVFMPGDSYRWGLCYCVHAR